MALVQDVFMPDDDEQHELALHNLAESQRKANKALQIANSVIGTAFYVLNSTAQQELINCNCYWIIAATAKRNAHSSKRFANTKSGCKGLTSTKIKLEST